MDMITDKNCHVSAKAGRAALVLMLLTLSAVADTYVLNSALSGRDDIDWTVASS